MNTPTARVCQCDPGYVGDGGSCTDENECLTNNGGCSGAAACINTVGSRLCLCLPGYAGDGGTCDDIDECATDAGCPTGAVCNNQPGTFSCGCPDGYSGTAPNCVDINECQANNGGCDPYATCTNTTGSRLCACKPGFTGDGGVCADINECLTNNGGCNVDWGSCVNTPGSRTCACDGGTGGTTCDTCLAGYIRIGDQACQPSCSKLVCGTAAHCDGTTFPAQCACSVGYSGVDAGCSQCAPGFAPADGGVCARSVPVGTTLLAVGTAGGETVLLAVDVDAGTATPLKRMPDYVSAIATDPNAHRIAYTSFPADSLLNAFDPVTGQSTLLGQNHSGNLAFHPGLNEWFSTTTSNASLEVVPADGGAISKVGTSSIGMQHGGLGYDPLNNQLVAVGKNFSGDVFFSTVNPQDGGYGALGSIPNVSNAYAENVLGITVNPASGNYWLGIKIGLPEGVEMDTRWCRKMARQLGLTGYDNAPTTVVDTYNGIGAGQTYTLQSTQSSGKEIIGFITYGNANAAAGTLKINVNNPDAFLCMSTYEEVVQLQLTATAKFAAAYYAGFQPKVSALVDAAYVPPARPNFYVYNPYGTNAGSVTGNPAVFRILTTAQVTDRGLSYSPGGGSSFDPNPVGTLLEVDRSTLSILQRLRFPGVELNGPLAPVP